MKINFKEDDESYLRLEWRKSNESMWRIDTTLAKIMEIKCFCDVIILDITNIYYAQFQFTTKLTVFGAVLNRIS